MVHSLTCCLPFRYPDYEFIGDEKAASKAGSLGTRYDQGSLYDVVFDIFMLSKCDYIVCTFSSNVSLRLTALLYCTPSVQIMFGR